MSDLRNLIIRGIREAVRHSQIIGRAFNIQQEREEGPGEFLTRLKEQMRKYSGLNVEDPLGQGMLKLHFVTNSWPDVAKKLQKPEGWQDRNLEDLLREAQKVYVRRDKEKQKRKAKRMLSAVEKATPGNKAPRNERPRASMERDYRADREKGCPGEGKMINVTRVGRKDTLKRSVGTGRRRKR